MRRVLAISLTCDAALAAATATAAADNASSTAPCWDLRFILSGQYAGLGE